MRENSLAKCTHTQLMINFKHDELYPNPFYISSLQLLHYLYTSRWLCLRLTDEGRLEEGLWATEPLVTNGDDLTVGKLVALLQGG